MLIVVALPVGSFWPFGPVGTSGGVGARSGWAKWSTGVKEVVTR